MTEATRPEMERIWAWLRRGCAAPSASIKGASEPQRESLEMHVFCITRSGIRMPRPEMAPEDFAVLYVAPKTVRVR